MKYKLLYLCTALIFAATPVLVHAKTACPPSGNATTTIYDADASGNLLLMRSDDFNGAGQATYSAADANVSSSLYCGTYFLKLYSQSARTLFITPNSPYGTQPSAPPPGYYWQYVELATSCYDSFGNTVPLNNVITFSNNCRQSLDFGYGGTKYKMALGPTSTGVTVATGLVTVTCNAVTSGSCVNWTVTPYSGGAPAHPPDVADLNYYARGGKLTYIGQYYFTFSYNITLP